MVVVVVVCALLSLGAHLWPHSISLTQQKLESGSDDPQYMHMIKVCLTSEIFLYCVETKEYCKQSEAWEFFFAKTWKIFEEFLGNFW